MLKDYGLSRIQKSAFMGSLSRSTLSSLVSELRGMVEEDNLKIFPLCDPDFRGMISIGREYREEGSGVVVFY